MKEYHGAHKDSHYWVSASEIEAKAKPEPTRKPTKTAIPKYKNFTAIEDGETVYYTVQIAKPMRLDGMQI